MRTVNVAVVGCGSIARSAHVPSYAKNPHVRIKYLVDIRPERAERLAREYQVPYFTDNLEEMLADGEVEAVSVCTPNATHAPITIACLNAGKNVLCEKPAAINYEQVKEMKEAADRNGKILNLGHVNRFNTAVNLIKDMIASGELGKVYHINCSFRDHRSIPGLGGPFTTKSIAGGGVLIDWGVHFLDLIFYCMEPVKVKSVSASTYSEMAKDMKSYAYINMWAGPPDYSGTYDVEDYVTGIIRTDGPTININGAWAQNIGERAMFIEFLGDKAGIKLQYGGNFKVYGSKNGVLYEMTPSFREGDMFYDEIDSFIKSVIENRKDRTNIDNTMMVSQVMDAIYKSAELGREVTL